MLRAFSSHTILLQLLIVHFIYRIIGDRIGRLYNKFYSFKQYFAVGKTPPTKCRRGVREDDCKRKLSQAIRAECVALFCSGCCRFAQTRPATASKACGRKFSQFLFGALYLTVRGAVTCGYRAGHFAGQDVRFSSNVSNTFRAPRTAVITIRQSHGRPGEGNGC